MVAIALLSATAVADDRIFGHVDPFPDEVLPSPVRLRCGLVITEWRPARTDAATIARVDRMCTRAMAAFLPFLAAEGRLAEAAGVSVDDRLAVPAEALVSAHRGKPAAHPTQRSKAAPAPRRSPRRA